MAMIRTAHKSTVERGDAMQIVRMSFARGLRNGKGYSFSYVRKCLKKKYHNAEIAGMHDELVALRTPKRSKQ